MTIHGIKSALWRTGEAVVKKHTLQMAAALSYYFILSLFPGLIFLSAVVAYLPVPDLFNQALAVMSTMVPPDSMGVVRQVLSDIISPHRATFLSFGLVAALWAASGGFAAAIEALDIACEVRETRPFWKTRPLALALTFMAGLLSLVALGVMIVGPEFGTWLTSELYIPGIVVRMWPYIHWAVAGGFTVLSLELLYFLAPNARQRFLETLPGSVVAVSCWIGLSYALGLYFRNFANLNKTYGTLGAAVALMVWLYWINFIMLVGAELNTELAREARAGKYPDHFWRRRRSDRAA